MLIRILVTFTLLAPLGAFAQSHEHSTPYAGQQTREIKSLSDEDIAQLRTGAGWGLALPAELSGLPGPAHVLELKEELALTNAQLEEITEIHAQMRKDAIDAGERFIEAEAAISRAFLDASVSSDVLSDLLGESAQARAALRYVHLSRHLETPNVLTADQIKKYNVLRGYADDPCTNVPEGHDPNMWRRHNGCE